MKLTPSVKAEMVSRYRKHPTQATIKNLIRWSLRTRAEVVRVLDQAGALKPDPPPPVRSFQRPPRPRPTAAIGARIAHIQDLLGLTLTQFGRLLHRTEGSTCILEKGYHARIGAEVLVRLALLGFRPIWVLEGSGDRQMTPEAKEWPSPSCYLPLHLLPLVAVPQNPTLPVPPFRPPSWRQWPVSQRYQDLLDGKLACRFCGAKIPPYEGKGRTVPDVCHRPGCRTQLQREHYAHNYAAATVRLGFAPCRACWKNPLPEKGTRCPECKQKIAQRYRAVKQSRQQQGLCLRCDNPYKHGDYLCHMHREEALTLWETTIGQRIWKAIAAQARMTKEERAAYSKDYQHRRYLRFKRKGKCYRCGCPKDPAINWPACPQHHQEQNSGKRFRWRRAHPIVATSPAKVEGEDDRGRSHEAGPT